MKKSAITSLFLELEPIRKNDNYCSEELKEELITMFLPKTTCALTLDLSNVTSAFYGLSLKCTADLFGVEVIDKISKDVFYNLGVAKANQCYEKFKLLPKDTRAFAYVIVSAIYNASPEYNFSIHKFSEKHTIVELEGVDRYLRILNQLNISEYVTFPTLLPFMEGVKDFLKIDCKIECDFNSDSDSNKTKCTYNFKKVDNERAIIE